MYNCYLIRVGAKLPAQKMRLHQWSDDEAHQHSADGQDGGGPSTAVPRETATAEFGHKSFGTQSLDCVPLDASDFDGPRGQTECARATVESAVRGESTVEEAADIVAGCPLVHCRAVAGGGDRECGEGLASPGPDAGFAQWRDYARCACSEAVERPWLWSEAGDAAARAAWARLDALPGSCMVRGAGSCHVLRCEGSLVQERSKVPLAPSASGRQRPCAICLEELLPAGSIDFTREQIFLEGLGDACWRIRLHEPKPRIGLHPATAAALEMASPLAGRHQAVRVWVLSVPWGAHPLTPPWLVVAPQCMCHRQTHDWACLAARV